MIDKNNNPKKGSTNRRKGHDAERQIARELRDIGYIHAATSRATSRQLDDAKVDINYVPFNIQSKAVKQNLNFRDYLSLINEVNDGVASLPPDHLVRITYPTVIFHKKDRQTLCVMSKEDFYNLIKKRLICTK